MSQQKAANQQVAGIGVAAAALVTAAVIPMIAAQHTTANGDLSPDVALTSLAGDIPSVPTVDPSGPFDLGGLLQAEVTAGEALFNGVIGVPGGLVGDVVSGVESAINDAIDLNFGEAFSSLTGIPPAIAGTLLGAAGLPIGLYDMVAVIPGEYLFNFGGDASSTAAESFGAVDPSDLGSVLGDLTGGIF